MKRITVICAILSSMVLLSGCVYTQEEIENIKDNAKEEGFLSGYDEGYYFGHKDGYQDGYGDALYDYGIEP